MFAIEHTERVGEDNFCDNNVCSYNCVKRFIRSLGQDVWTFPCPDRQIIRSNRVKSLQCWNPLRTKFYQWLMSWNNLLNYLSISNFFIAFRKRESRIYCFCGFGECRYWINVESVCDVFSQWYLSDGLIIYWCIFRWKICITIWIWRFANFMHLEQKFIPFVNFLNFFTLLTTITIKKENLFQRQTFLFVLIYFWCGKGTEKVDVANFLVSLKKRTMKVAMQKKRETKEKLLTQWSSIDQFSFFPSPLNSI